MPDKGAFEGELLRVTAKGETVRGFDLGELLQG